MTREEALQIARQYVSKEIGDQYQVVAEHFLEASSVFVFHYHSKKYLETGDVRLMTVGQGPTIIDKEDGKITAFGSAYSTQAAIDSYLQEKRKRHYILLAYPAFEVGKSHDLTITEIHHREGLLDVLLAAGLYYVIPEVEGDTIWRIPKPYQKKLLEERLATPPTTFKGITGSTLLELYLQIKKGKLAEILITDFHPVVYEKNPARATAKDLEPKW